MTSTTLSNVGTMPAKRFSLTLDHETAEEIKQFAAAAGQTVSAWLAEAARERLRSDGLRVVVADWEAEHGAFTDDEIDDARREMGLIKPTRRDAGT